MVKHVFYKVSYMQASFANRHATAADRASIANGEDFCTQSNVPIQHTDWPKGMFIRSPHCRC